MKNKEHIFLKDSEIAFDRRHRKILSYNISKYDQAVNRGKKRYSDFQAARQYASCVKEDVVTHLPEYLTQFEEQIKSRGAEVIWASDSNSALESIGQILEENNCRLIVKSKSMITEEIGFNEFAGELNKEAVETDLGEFIVQTAGEKPYHILTPAMHKSKEDVARLFNLKFELPADAPPERIAGFVRQRLRKIFREADVGVTGANFIVADIGGIGLTENEGNGLMTVSFPRLHIVLAGIERVLPSVRQLPFFFQWLGVHGTGQNLSAYNSLILGPKTSDETDGPEKMVVILLDNRRSKLLAEGEESLALKCIRCGACLNACPIYKNAGGYTYASPYSGPVGSVITPFYRGFNDYGHLSFACSLCGRCSEVCPVKIPLHELLLLNRKRKIEKFSSSVIWKHGMKAYRYAFMKRGRLDFLQGKSKNFMVSLFRSVMGDMKTLPMFAEKSFTKQYKSLNK